MLTLLMKLSFIGFSFFFFDYLKKRGGATRSGNTAAEIKMYLNGLDERCGQSIKVLTGRRRRRRNKGKEERENLSGRGGGGVRRRWRAGGREAITAVSSVTDLHRPLHSPFSAAAPLSMKLLSSVAPPLKFLLRFHKKKKEKKNQIAAPR